MNILFFGDIVGRIGLEALSSLLPSLIKKYHADFVIANGENVSGGFGITETDYHALIEAGVDVVTLGNHYKSKRQIEYYIEDAEQLIRPLNLLDFEKGYGSSCYQVGDYLVRVTNILGTAFMRDNVKNPAQALLEVLNEEEPTQIHIVDYHAESTSEKKAFAAFFDGRVSAVIGTHTHVQTYDAFIFSGGTGFLSDAGMCGAYDSVIGSSPESVIDRFILGKESRLSIPDEGRGVVCFVHLEIDEMSGQCIMMKPYTYVDGRIFDGQAHI